MGQCPLSDIPAAIFQDFASLRQVSRTVCQRTTQHVPYITLPLTSLTSGSIDQLQQWSQATVNLQHISNIHVHIACHIAKQQLDSAMQLLSQRSRRVTELQLLPVRSSSSSSSSGDGDDVVPAAPAACLPTLQPLQHLLPGLRTLVIEGVFVDNMARHLKELAAAAAAATGGWQQLQSLTLDADWSYPRSRTSGNSSYHEFCHWADFAAAIKELSKVLPNLKQLQINIPSLLFIPQDIMRIAGIHLEDYLDDTEFEIELPEHKEARFAQHVLVAALANALLQLKSLEVLSVSYLPDIWCGMVAAATAAAAPKSAALADEILGDGLLSSMSAAAAAFPTSDDYGCWLLQHLANLRELQLCVGDPRCSVSWQWRKKQPAQQSVSYDDSSSSSSGNSSSARRATCRAAADICSISMDYWIDIPERSSQQQYGTSRVGSSSSSSQPPLPYDIPLVPYYSFRSSSSLARHMSRCQLNLYGLNVDGLADLLASLESLKHFEIRNVCCAKRKGCPSRAAGAVTAVVAAAATAQGLQSFTMQLCGSRDLKPSLMISDDMLLPLTAAAGGPGSNLKKLKLVGNFITNAAAGRAAGKAAGKAAAIGPVSRWYEPLQQLDGLHELIIINHNHDHLLGLPVESLPAGLEVFEGKGLHIYKSNATAAAAAAAASDHQASSGQLSNDTQGDCTPAESNPQLHKLRLTSVHLSGPSILASDRLHQLSLDNSSWSGGSAAAGAWPNVRELVRDCGHAVLGNNVIDNSSSSSMHIGSTTASALVEDRIIAMCQPFQQEVTEAIVAFKHIRFLSVQNLPPLSVRVIQHIMQQVQQLRHLQVGHYKPGELLYIRLVGRIKDTFGHVKNFDIPKMLNMRKYANSIREFGMIALADTGPRERMNKDLRATYNTTNRKLSGLTQQVADKLNVKEAIRWSAAVHNLQQQGPAKATGARQRALATFEASISNQGRKFIFAKLSDVNIWEYKAVDAIPELDHLQAAVHRFLETEMAPTSIMVKSTLGIVRYEGVADIVRGHPVLTGRQHNCLTLDSIAYKGLSPDPVTHEDVEGIWYGQVYALGSIADKHFVFIRNYASPVDVDAKDDRRCPLTLRPLVWEPTPRLPIRNKRRKVNKTPGSFSAIPINSVLHKVCIVPDYSRNPEQDFLVNDLVHTVSEDCLLWGD